MPQSDSESASTPATSAGLTLADCERGARVVVEGLLGRLRLRERLAELGFTPGTLLEVARRAPLGDPVYVRLRGGAFALRRDEAGLVRVVRATDAA